MQQTYTLKLYVIKSGEVSYPNRRAYPATMVARLRFIKNAQELGFSLAEIEKLLALRVDSVTSCAEVRRQAEVKLTEVEQKLQALQQIHTALSDLVAACEQGGPQGECPILEVLEERARQPEKNCQKPCDNVPGVAGQSVPVMFSQSVPG